MRIYLVLVFFFCFDLTYAADLFNTTEPLSIELQGPVTKVIRAKRKGTSHPFQLTVGGDTLSVSVNARGNSRKTLCSFPPLKVTFGEDAHGSAFSTTPSVRLVTHCNGSKSARDKVLLEFLAYRIFNLLSEVSYQPRLLDITYIDTSQSKKDKTQRAFGFVTESEHELARRVGAKLSRQGQVKRAELNQIQAATVNLFHYLIGNTDWSFVAPFNESDCCHNGQLLERNKEVFIAPYDFDLSGLVKARYAKPNPKLPINRVTTRYYQGVCVSDEDLHQALLQIHQKREAVLALISELPELSDKEGVRVRAYLNQFFDRTQDYPKRVGQFSKKCV